MVSAKDLIKEVNNFRSTNQDIIKKFESEIEQKLIQAARQGKTEMSINISELDSNDQNLHSCVATNDFFDGIKEAIISDLEKNKFKVHKSISSSHTILIFW